MKSAPSFWPKAKLPELQPVVAHHAPGSACGPAYLGREVVDDPVELRFKIERVERMSSLSAYGGARRRVDSREQPFLLSAPRVGLVVTVACRCA